MHKNFINDTVFEQEQYQGHQKRKEMAFHGRNISTKTVKLKSVRDWQLMQSMQKEMSYDSAQMNLLQNNKRQLSRKVSATMVK